MSQVNGLNERQFTAAFNKYEQLASQFDQASPLHNSAEYEPSPNSLTHNEVKALLNHNTFSLDSLSIGAGAVPMDHAYRISGIMIDLRADSSLFQDIGGSDGISAAEAWNYLSD